jgi:hypothetical protein
MIETSMHVEARTSDKVIPRTVGMRMRTRFSIPRSTTMSQAFEVEEVDAPSEEEVVSILYGGKFHLLYEEQAERARVREFWSDPCWSTPI